MTTSHLLDRIGVILLAAGLAGCCFGPGVLPPFAPAPAPAPGPTVPPTPPAGPTVPPTPPAGPTVPPTPPAGPTVPPTPPAGSQAITLAPGFQDPTTVLTAAGGPVPGSSMVPPGEWCAGNYAAAPNVLLTTTAPMPGLRVIGRATEDTTLAIRLADGRVFCNDDGAGYPNPAIDGSAIPGGIPAGTHQVFVGTFGSGGQAVPATIAFTLNPMLAPGQLP